VKQNCNSDFVAADPNVKVGRGHTGQIRRDVELLTFIIVG